MHQHRNFVFLIAGSILLCLTGLGTPMPHQATVMACPKHKTTDPAHFMQALWNLTDSPIQAYEYIPQNLLPLPVQAPYIQYGLPQFFVLQTAWYDKVRSPRPDSSDPWIKSYRSNYVFCAVVHVPVTSPNDMAKLLQAPTHHVPTDYINGSRHTMTLSMCSFVILSLACGILRRESR